VSPVFAVIEAPPPVAPPEAAEAERWLRRGAAAARPPARAPELDETGEAASFHVAPPILHATALFLVVRTTEAYLYPTPFADFGSAHLAHGWRDAFTRPPLFDAHRRAFEWDGDPWTINVFGHGLMGSELYVRARGCGFGWAGSLAFTALASGVWEYGFEGNGVRPSALDLVYTPLAGLALGEARWQTWRAAARLRDFGARTVLRAVVDPFGEIERALGSPC
jgi:hypothetical protein